MKRKKEKGFALVLSIVLLLVMSLMGASLIVISSGDHESNNVSDEYQQTFYVAEAGLLAGERFLLDQHQGYWDIITDSRMEGRLPVNEPDGSFWDGMMEENNRINYTDLSGDEIYIMNTENMCFLSFRSIDTHQFRVALDHNGNRIAHSWNFGEFILDAYTFLGDDELETEANQLRPYIYEYFITRVGSTRFRGLGGSIKKEATDTELDGMAYRVYACGIYQGKTGDGGRGRMIVALESLMVVPK